MKFSEFVPLPMGTYFLLLLFRFGLNSPGTDGDSVYFSGQSPGSSSCQASPQSYPDLTPGSGIHNSGMSSPELPMYHNSLPAYQNTTPLRYATAFSQSQVSNVINCRRTLDFDCPRKIEQQMPMSHWQEDFYPPYFNEYHHFPQVSSS